VRRPSRTRRPRGRTSPPCAAGNLAPATGSAPVIQRRSSPIGWGSGWRVSVLPHQSKGPVAFHAEKHRLPFVFREKSRRRSSRPACPEHINFGVHVHLKEMMVAKGMKGPFLMFLTHITSHHYNTAPPPEHTEHRTKPTLALVPLLLATDHNERRQRDRRAEATKTVPAFQNQRHRQAREEPLCTQMNITADVARWIGRAVVVLHQGVLSPGPARMICKPFHQHVSVI
jgi:hypothetical protein